MNTKFYIGFSSLMPTIILLACPVWAAKIPNNGSEKIISCSADRKGSYDPTNSFGQTLDIEVYQIPEGQFRWNLKVTGRTQAEIKTNGPINRDGTTVAPNG